MQKIMNALYMESHAESPIEENTLQKCAKQKNTLDRQKTVESDENK